MSGPNSDAFMMRDQDTEPLRSLQKQDETMHHSPRRAVGDILTARTN